MAYWVRIKDRYIASLDRKTYGIYHTTMMLLLLSLILCVAGVFYYLKWREIDTSICQGANGVVLVNVCERNTRKLWALYSNLYRGMVVSAVGSFYVLAMAAADYTVKKIVESILKNSQ